MANVAVDAQAETQGVRFADANQEIPPESSLRPVETLTGHSHDDEEQREGLGPEAQKELQQLRSTLQKDLQSNRMQHHAFEALSLPGSAPASRVVSGSGTPRDFRGSRPGSRAASPHSSTRQSVHSPPLTPAGSKSHVGKPPPAAIRPPDVMTPQRSASPARNEATAPVSSHPRSQPVVQLGPHADSLPPSKDGSPSQTPGSTAPATPRPFTPSTETAHGKRGSSIVDVSNQRFRFGDRDPSVGYANSGQANVTVPPTMPPPAMPSLPRMGSGGSIPTLGGNKRASGLFHIKKNEYDSADEGHHSSHSSSRSNLKRFFKFGDRHHKDKDGASTKPANGGSKDGTRTPPTGGSSITTHHPPSVPFADDHGLQSKYGKFGKILGSGAGGSVRLMKRSGDGVVFAVKQFRDRHAYESEKDYNKKVTAEFCIGSTLHHGNVIETIDIVHEKGRWYEVMEYAPFDLFATVMTGKMGREEVTCSTLQILSGVLYLHSMGLAHRDLKLDNVVINDRGIMKLIDFGSAVVFRYPFEKDVVLATGVVGSDPYLAPEVYDQARYDPRAADIWSIAIIFCCMTLRRFPWKAPRISDNSYRLFVAPPDPDQQKLLDEHRKSIAQHKAATSAPPSRHNSGEDGGNKPQAKSEPVSRQTTQSSADQQPTIKGPIRLLRLLPRETRHIIGRMLELDPRKRATMDEILQNEWVMNSLVCRQEENGQVIPAPNHTHTLQPSNAPQT